MPEDRWYYLDNETTVGPFSWVRLKGLASASLIQADTLIWREGTNDWRPFQSAEREMSRPPPLPSEGRIVASAPVQPVSDDARGRAPLPRRDVDATPGQANETSASRVGPYRGAADRRGWKELPVSPWRRYFARMLDTTLNGAVGFTILGFGFYAFAPLSAEAFFESAAANRIVDVFLTTLIAVPINAILIGLTGSTLGKVLFGVKVVDKQLKPIGLMKSFVRELRVWTSGMGLGIPLINLIMLVTSFNHLQKTGVTFWDSRGGLIVLHRPVAALQYCLYIVGVTSIAFVFGATLAVK